MMAPNILLRKQYIKVQTDQEPLAHELRKKLNGTILEDLEAMLEKVFSQTDTTNTHLHIDKLSLDLGSMSVQTFEEQFVRLVEINLIQALKQQFENAPSNKNERESSLIGEDSASRSAGQLRMYSVEQQELIALVYFLEKGIFPWWVQKNRLLTPDALLNKIFIDQKENIILKIITLSRHQPKQVLQSIVARLFIFLFPSRHKEAVTLLVDQYNDPVISVNSKLLIQYQEEIRRFVSIKNFYKELFEFLIAMDDKSQGNLIYEFIRQLVKKSPLPINPFPTSFTPGEMDSDIKNAFLTIVKETKDQQKKENEDLQKKPSGLEMSSAEEQEGIFINNGGLILLHPFLPALFSHTGLLSENQTFISNEARQKATVLLYYLQSGEELYREWEMPLNKMICGLGIEEVLQQDILISEEDKQRCDQLLEAVVQHWKALKGASVQAVQQTFLLREGKMSLKEEHWTIQIERTGADILLERLPWGLGTVKFPWAKKLIHIQW